LLTAKMAGLRLRLHRHKTQVHRSRDGLKFLGFNLWADGRRLQQSSLKRLNRRLRRQRWLRKQGLTGFPEIRQSLQAWLKHAQGANSDGIVRAVSRRFSF